MALTNIVPQSAQKYTIPSSLTHSSGIITAVVGGSNYQVTLTGLVANTLYFLYITSGTLVFNTIVPSTYRVSNPNSFLVGAFYSNGLTSVAFGSFCTIEGVPTTLDIEYTATLLNLGATPPQNIRWMRIGQRFVQYFRINMQTGGGAGASFSIPFTPDLATDRVIGKWNGDSTVFSGALYHATADPLKAKFSNDAANWAVNLTGAAIGNNSFLTGAVDFAATEFSNTPLKDL